MERLESIIKKFLCIGVLVMFGQTSLATGPIIKPCAGRPGSAYPNEGTGNCRGNLSVQIDLPGIGISLIYNSQFKGNLGYGLGWSVSTDSYFEKTSASASASTGTLYLGDGTPISFTLSANQWNANYPVLFSSPLQNGSTLNILRDQGGQDVYSPTTSLPNRFALSSSSSLRGTEWSYTRGGAGALVQRMDFFGNRIAFYYPGGILSTINSLAGLVATMTYDIWGNLISVVYADGSATTLTYVPGTSLLASLTDPQGRKTTYAYSVDGIDNPLLSITDYQNYQTAFAYTSNSVVMIGLAKTLVENFSWANGNTTISTTDNGVTSTDTYDSQMRLVRAQDYFNNVRTLSYVGNTPFVLTVNKPDGTAATVNATNCTVVTVNEADGTVETYVYDAKMYPIQVSASHGSNTIVTKYLRDAYERVTNQTTNSVPTSYAYDATGNLTQITDASNKVAFSAAYSLGLPKSVTSIEGYSSTYSYDAWGHLMAASLPTGESMTRTSTVLDQTVTLYSTYGYSEQNVYDLIGRLVSESKYYSVPFGNTEGEIRMSTYPVAQATASNSSPVYQNNVVSKTFNRTQIDGSSQVIDIKGRDIADATNSYY